MPTIVTSKNAQVTKTTTTPTAAKASNTSSSNTTTAKTNNTANKTSTTTTTKQEINPREPDPAVLKATKALTEQKEKAGLNEKGEQVKKEPTKSVVIIDDPLAVKKKEPEKKEPEPEPELKPQNTGGGGTKATEEKQYGVVLKKGGGSSYIPYSEPTSTQEAVDTSVEDYYKQLMEATNQRLLDAYNYQQGLLGQDRDAALREAYIKQKMVEREYPELLAAKGLTGGATESTIARNNANYANARALARQTYTNNLGAAGQTYQSDLAKSNENYLASIAAYRQRLAEMQKQYEYDAALLRLKNSLENGGGIGGGSSTGLPVITLKPAGSSGGSTTSNKGSNNTTTTTTTTSKITPELKAAVEETTKNIGIKALKNGTPVTSR